MLPFRPPFNTSEIYADRHLMTVLGDFFAQARALALVSSDLRLISA